MASGVPITNDIQLMAAFSAEMTAIVDELTEWLLTQVRMSVEANVYSYPEGSMYERLGADGGFLGAWGKEVAKFASSYIESMVGIDPLGALQLEGATAMQYNPDMHQHGNSVGDDRREGLAQLIESGTGYDFGGNAAIPRDFWSPIIQIVEDGSLDVVLENLFGKHGIRFTKTF